VPALQRLAVRQISPRFLSQDERIEIADLRHAGLSVRQAARRLGRAPSTISRELRRNTSGSQGYRPFDAHRRATARRARSHRRRIEANGELRQLIGELLVQRWSPQQKTRLLAWSQRRGCDQLSRWPELPTVAGTTRFGPVCGIACLRRLPCRIGVWP
jgi:IS30 family transposase